MSIADRYKTHFLDKIEFLVRHGLERLVLEDPGIVDEDIYFAPFGDCLFNDLGTSSNRVRIGDSFTRSYER
jgi:hypothetical protein